MEVASRPKRMQADGHANFETLAARVQSLPAESIFRHNRVPASVGRKLDREWKPDHGVRLNLACGFDYREGWVNVDRYAAKCDLRMDMFQFPWPIPSDSVDFLLADQIIEHIPPIVDGQDGLIRILKEIHRIMKPGGRVYIGTPHFADPLWAIKNITHYRFFTDESLDFLDSTQPNHEANLQAQAGVRFHIAQKFLLRRRVLRFFLFSINTDYHFPKYLKWWPNVGRPWSIIFILEK